MKAISSELTVNVPRIKKSNLPFWKYTTGEYRPAAPKQWDICYKYEYPYNVLCNFTPSHFLFDGVEIDSMEGFLQALKVKDQQVQRKICTLPGFLAKKLGNFLKRSGEFDREHLYWMGKSYDRYSPEYQELLKRAYDAKFAQDKYFRSVLNLSKGHELTHDIGKSDPRDTILTEKEFIERLEFLRQRPHKASIVEYLKDKIRENRLFPNNPVAISKALTDVQTSSINGHFICGESLFIKHNLKYVNKKYGIKNIIDINIDANTAEKHKKLCEEKGIGYINITTEKEINIESIQKLIETYNSGEFSYINCTERQQANIPLSLNYLFNPKADISDAILFGAPRRTFLNSLKKIVKQIYKQPNETQNEIADINEVFDKIKLLSELN